MTWRPSKLTREQMEERRLEGGRLLKEGKLSKAEIARELSVTWECHCLGESARSRRPAAIAATEEFWAEVEADRGCEEESEAFSGSWRFGGRISDGPVDACAGERSAQEGIRHQLSPEHALGRVLDDLGYSVQKPLPRAAERDEELVKAWLAKDWPRIKKSLRLGAIIVFFDEFGFSYLEPLATTWARKGKRPIARRVARDRRVLSTAVALTMSGKIYKRHFEGSIKSDQVITTLQHVQRHISGKLILIWDRARTHKSKKTQAYLSAHPEILVEELPAYAPELNPEEYCHGNVKHHLKNARPTNKTEIRQMLDRGFARLRRRPDLLLSFFHAAGLSVHQLQLNRNMRMATMAGDFPGPQLIWSVLSRLALRS